MTVSKLFVIDCVLIFLLWSICCCISVQYQTSFDSKKSVSRLKPLKAETSNDFTTFQDYMSKKFPSVNETTMNSKKVKEWYAKEIGSKRIDFTDTAQTSRITTSFLSMICALCNGECPCLQSLECPVAC